MAVDDLVVRAAIRDEMSRPLREITGELDRLRREANQAAAATNRLGAAAARATSGMADTARSTSMATGAMRALGGMAQTTARYMGLATAAGVGFGLKTASHLEQAEIAFRTLMGSAGEAAGYMTQLRQLAQNTPFSLPDLTSGAQRLMAMGYSADLAKQALIAAGNAAASIGSGREGVERITLAFAQMMSTGRVMGEEVRQLNQAGVDAFGILAEAAGKSVIQIRTESQAGLLDAATNVPILIEGINKRLGNAMEEQSKTLRGLWTRLTETMQLGLADALKPSEETIKEFLRQLIAAVGPFSQALAQVGIAMLPALSALTDALLPVAPVVADVARLVGGALAEAITILAPHIPLLAGAFRDVMRELVPLVPVLAGPLTEALVEIAPHLPDMARALVDIAEAAVLLTPLLVGIAGGIAAIAGTTGGVWLLVGAWGAYKLAMMASSTWTQTQLKWTIALDTWTKISTSTLGTYTGVLWLNVGAQYAANRALGMGVIAAGAWALWSGIATVATSAWAVASWTLAIPILAIEAPIWAVVLVVAALVAGIYLAWKHFGWFRDAVGWVWDKLTGFWGWLTSIDFGGALSGVVSFAKGAWDGFLGSITSVIDALKTAWDWMQRTGQGIGGALNPFDGDKIPFVGDTATSRGSGGGLDNTMRMHAAIMAGQGGKVGISNALMGGGGFGPGSGDHQAGRALDLVGSGLNSYAQTLRSMGGYAAFHGSGRGRHLHGVYPAGDTNRSMVRRPVAASSGGGGGDTVVIQEGALTIHASAGVDVEAQARRALESWTRDRAERT